jgi:carbon monoxide dehydrogenase subunit G
MAICVLRPDQKKILYKKISRDLYTQIEKGTPFSLKDYVSSIYNFVMDKKKDEGYALAYAGMVPSHLALASGVSKKIRNHIGKGILDVYDLEKQFEDTEYIAKYLGKAPVDPELKAKFDGEVRRQEAEENQMRKLSDGNFFSARPNTLNATTGDERETDMAFSYGFVKFALDNELLQASEGLYITAMNAADVLTEEDAPREGMRLGVVQVITDEEGNPIYFDSNYSRVSPEEGKLVFFRLRENLSTIQTVEEMVKTTMLPVEDVVKMREEQQAYTIKKKNFVLSGKGNKVIQRITGGSYGIIDTDFNNPNDLSSLDDLSKYKIEIMDLKTQTLAFVRGSHRVPLTFNMKPIMSNQDLLDAGVDIIFGDVTDEAGKKSNVLDSDRQKFVKVFFGNIKAIQFVDGQFMINGAPVVSKEQIKETLSYFIGAKTKKLTPTTINYYSKYSGGVPFYERKSDGSLILKPDGMTPVQYRKFIQNNAVTYLQKNDQGEIEEVNGYLTFEEMSPEMSKIETKAAVEVAPVEEKAEATNEKAEADKLPPIEQNFTDGQGGRKMQPQFSGKSTMDLILSGDRTRTTRAKTDITRMIKDYGLSKIEDLVGKVIRMTDKKGRTAYTKITKVSSLTQEYQDSTWQKEGWEKSVTDPLVGKYPYAIEFELIDKPTTVKKVTRKTFAKKNQLSDDQINKIIDDENTFNKLKSQKLINEGVTREQLIEARDWYESTDLFKKAGVTFAEMFNIVNSANPDSVATFNEAGITLFKGSDYTDLYHEAWHVFTKMFLPQSTIDKLEKEVRGMKGSFVDYAGNTISFSDADPRQIEEYLAEKFRAYMLSGGKKTTKDAPVQKSIFKKILEVLNILFNFKVEDITLNEQASSELYRQFERLRIGRLTPVQKGLEASRFTGQDKIKVFNEANAGMADEIGYTRSMQLVESIDSLFSQYIDEYNKKNGKKYTASLLSSPETRADAYNYVYNKMAEKLEEYYEQLDSLEEGTLEYNTLADKIETLQFGLDEFSDATDTITGKDVTTAIDTGKGLMGYHLEKSKYLSFDELFAEMADDQAETATSRDSYAQKSGNEIPMHKLADKEVLYLVRSLYEFEKGKLQYNELGFPKLLKFDTAWNKIQKALENISDADQMYKALLNKKDIDKSIDQLITKLGRPDVISSTDILTPGNQMQIALWTKFRNAFSGKRIPLVQLTVDLTQDSQNNITKVTLKPGNAKAEIDKITRTWNRLFTSPNHPNKYISKKVDQKGERVRPNYLKVDQIVEDFKGIYNKKPIEFLNSLGILVPNEPEIVRELKVGELRNFTNRLYDKLKKAAASEVPVYFNNPSELIKYDTDETNKYNLLLDLVARNSEEYGTAMVSNAKNDPQYELSLRSTVSQMIDAINNASTYEELIADPRMSHLDVKRNPFIKNLFTMKALFGENLGAKEEEPQLEGTTKKARFVLENSSGVAVSVNDVFQNLGIASAEADPITQTLQNFYTMMIYGVAEGTRHSDKSTTYLYRLIFPQTNKKHYINISDFTRYSDINDPRTTTGNRIALNQFMNYLNSEVERINRLKAGDESGNVLVGNNTYKEVGTKLVIFKGILKKETREKIESYTGNDFQGYLDKNTKLKNEIEGQILDYFDNQVEEFKKDVGKINLSARDQMMSQIRNMVKANSQNAAVNVDDEVIDEVAFRTYVLNDWIHKYETTVMFYGDPALYNMKKEEFHKRNAGIAGTGTIPRTDKSMITILNTVFKPRYQDSQWFKKSNLKAEDKEWSTTMNSALLEDTKSVSAYITEYVNAKIQAEEKRLNKKLTKKEVDEIKDQYSEYAEMKEGDGQGWISFDAYRALLNQLGKWSPYQENLYNKILNGEDVSSTDVSKFFPVKKMQYWGPLMTSENSLPVVGFHKFSLLPLIPNLIKDTNLEVLHNKMVSQGIDYAAFGSSSKISTITANGKIDKFYDDQSADNTDVAFAQPDYKFTKNVIFLDYFKDQVETSDVYKGKTIFLTQLRKLIEEGMMNQGVPIDFTGTKEEWDGMDEDQKLEESDAYKKIIRYEQAVSAFTDFKIKELEREAGITYDENGLAKMSDKLIQFVKKELTRQDLAEHEIDFIKFNESGSNLTYDLSIHPSAEKIERLLSALVYKRIVRQKVKGEALIQVSGAGFEKAGRRKMKTMLDGTNQLAFYRKRPDGSIAPMQVKISMQGDFKKLLKLKDDSGKIVGTVDRLNQLIKDEKWLEKNRELITITGARVPVGGLNFMEVAEIVEFFPESSGNIIVLPAEIVVKSGSDFDIDKLGFMFPSLLKTSKGVSLVKHDPNSKIDIDATKEKIKALYAKLDEANQDVFNYTKQYLSEIPQELKTDFYQTVTGYKQEIRRINNEIWNQFELGEIYPEQLYEDLYSIQEELDELYKIAAKPLADYKESKVGTILNEIDKLKEQLAAAGSGGLENELIASINDILLSESNFVDLVTPNGTFLVKPLAEKLAKSVRDYDPMKNATGERFDSITGTKIFELGYNRYKQNSNNIGKKTLGLGAVDNTYNTVFNRIGAYMSPSAKIKDYTVQQRLLMPHNQISTPDGMAISLSNLYSQDQKTRISTVIAQMMNGWVDVAKDSWIFDIQGNPELSPSLLFLIQAGVPLEQAVYFMSQPIIRDYVEKQRLIRSTFAQALGTNAERPNYYRIEARKKILLPIARTLDSYKQESLGSKKQKKFIYEDMIPNIIGDRESFSFKELEDNLGKQIGDYSKFDYQVFLHFIEIEEMAKATTAVKLGMNFDTARATSIYALNEKLENAEALENETRMPSEVIANIEKNSPIGSFKRQSEMIDILSQLFPLRTNPRFIDFITDISKQFDPSEIQKQFPGAFANKEQFINALRNDFTNYAFQQWLYDPNRFDKRSPYRGSKATVEVSPVTLLERGAYVEDGILYVDFTQMEKDFKSGAYSGSEYIARDLAVVPEGHFSSGNSEIARNSYYKFVYERETLRYMIPYSKYSKTEDFKFRKEAQSKSMPESQRNRMAYEEYLKDTALLNTYNIPFMFYDPNGFAAQVARVELMFPEEMSKFRLFSSLQPDFAGRTKNLRLSEASLDTDAINAYHEDLQKLSDPSVQKVENQLDNDRISNLFSMFPIFAFLQAGQDGKNSFSLARIVNTGKFSRIMDAVTQTAIRNINENYDYFPHYWNLFMDQYTGVSAEAAAQHGVEATQYRRKNLKNYFAPAYTSERKKTFYSSDYDSSVLLFNIPINYTLEIPKGETRKPSELLKEAVGKKLKKALKKNDVLVFDDSLVPYSIDNQSTMFLSSKYTGVSGTIVKDLVGDGVIPKENTAGIITKTFSKIVNIDQFITDDTYEANIETIEKGIQELIKLRDDIQNPRNLIFSSRGYGLSLLGYGYDENVKLRELENAPAPKTFVYLSNRLREEFGYVNPMSRVLAQSRAEIAKTQRVTDDQVREQFLKCFSES